MLGVLERDGERVAYKRKLIEVALPLDAISAASARERTSPHGHPSTLHQWWARRPLAACRAVLWASLVDDPSAHPEQFPTEADRNLERGRLFGILERLVEKGSSTNPEVLAEARAEIDRSCHGEMPNLIDPFCGGGTIPVEAQRLGIPAYGGDLNPVAVLISKALVEIPPRFAGLPPVNPDSRDESGLKTWERAQGLAEDIGYYGGWVRDRAFERIGHLYPTVTLPADDGGGEAKVVAWIWARTVRSPDPAWNAHVPLVRSWVLRKVKGNRPAVYVQPTVDRRNRVVSFLIREDGAAPEGTVGRRGGTCLATGSPISFDYIADQGRRGLMGRTPIALIAEGNRRRTYLVPVQQPEVDEPLWSPRIPLPQRTLGFRVQRYGMIQWADLFTDRQLLALATFSDLLDESRSLVERHARLAGLVDDGIRLRDGGRGIVAYADAVTTYLSFVVNRCADLWASLVTWNSTGQTLQHVFGRQAIPMIWDYAEANPFSNSSGNWLGQMVWIQKALTGLPADGHGTIRQQDAESHLSQVRSPLICTDPPYYDNVPYADLSDFFYVWLRYNLSDIWPEEMATLLTPKADELVANPYRVDQETPTEPSSPKDLARRHFEEGMARVLSRIGAIHHSAFPATIFYAFKQQEARQVGVTSTGWETFLQGLVDSSLQITATWPIRTEMPSRMRAMASAALASSIVIACRPRPPNSPMATRRELLDALAAELPTAVRILQSQAIAPVDMAQSAIGPGMEIFSRYAKVLEADGTPMRVRTALALINDALEEVLSAEETEFDAPTRWALTWYEQFGPGSGPFGDAETLAKAKNTAVDGVVRAGIIDSRAGKVRLLTRDALDEEWDPITDRRLTVWMVAQQMIARLDHGEDEAADLLRKVGGGMGDRARRLTYLLYQIADRKGRSEDAVAYNGLIQAWHHIARRAAAREGPVEQTLGI